MNNFKKLLKEFSLYYDIINTILGIALIISMIVIFVTTSKFGILAAFLLGGSMNFINGLKFMDDPKRKTMGMSFLLMGVILIIIGFVIIQLYPSL